MADYKIEDFVYGPGAADEVAALVETKLETLDSTDNPIYLLQFLQDSRSKDEVVAVLIYGTP
jgi:hypothetical protein